MKKLKELDDGNQQQEIMTSPTKLGTGWVRVTPDNIKMFEALRDQSVVMRSKISDFFAEIGQEMDMTADELRAWIHQDENK
jgi:vacuolar-type H+-ATPase catalytic subunit A/Vma1